MKLNEQQAEATRRIKRWYRDADAPQVFKLFGYAGTGKTTLARIVADDLGVTVAFAAYTGKAVHVLRTKGCENARTIHSWIYIPVTVLREEIDGLRAELDDEENPERRRDLIRRIRDLEREAQEPGWILNETSDLRDVDLLVVDEVSMVDEAIGRDLLSFGVPILVLGDPAQLPPVKGKPYFISGKPDYMLTTVHRQAAKSPVIQLATGVRAGKRLIAQEAGKSRIYLPLTEDAALRHTQVIVGTNNSRWKQIRRLRDADGLTGSAPLLGDRVICLSNNPDLNVYNGQTFKVEDVISRSKRFGYTMLRLRTDDGERRDIGVWLQGFRGPREQEDFTRVAHHHREFAFMTFAQAITCHKAQGSQWRSVLVVDEARYFRGHATNWMYTAITRAEKRVSIVKPTQQNWV